MDSKNRSKKEDLNPAILEQLQAFGFQKKDIIDASHKVSNPTFEALLNYLTDTPDQNTNKNDSAHEGSLINTKSKSAKSKEVKEVKSSSFKETTTSAKKFTSTTTTTTAPRKTLEKKKEPLSHDEFLATYKVTKCKDTSPTHDKKSCNYYHSAADRRRNPNVYKYSTEDCENPIQCKKGDECNFAHNSLEKLFHPDTYKVAMCQSVSKKSKCDRGEFCAFAHDEKDLRVVAAVASSSSKTVKKPSKAEIAKENNAANAAVIEKLVKLINEAGSDGINSTDLPKKFQSTYNEPLDLYDANGNKAKVKEVLDKVPEIVLETFKKAHHNELRYVHVNNSKLILATTRLVDLIKASSLAGIKFSSITQTYQQKYGNGEDEIITDDEKVKEILVSKEPEGIIKQNRIDDVYYAYSAASNTKSGFSWSDIAKAKQAPKEEPKPVEKKVASVEEAPVEVPAPVEEVVPEPEVEVVPEPAAPAGTSWLDIASGKAVATKTSDASETTEEETIPEVQEVQEPEVQEPEVTQEPEPVKEPELVYENAPVFEEKVEIQQPFPEVKESIKPPGLVINYEEKYKNLLDEFMKLQSENSNTINVNTELNNTVNELKSQLDAAKSQNQELNNLVKKYSDDKNKHKAFEAQMLQERLTDINTILMYIDQLESNFFDKPTFSNYISNLRYNLRNTFAYITKIYVDKNQEYDYSTASTVHSNINANVQTNQNAFVNTMKNTSIGYGSSHANTNMYNTNLYGSNTNTTSNVGQTQEHRCFLPGCKEKASVVCPLCHEAYYCTGEHFNLHWSTHAITCPKHQSKTTNFA